MDPEEKCASEVIQSTLRGFLMMGNHLFIILTIATSFYITFYALKKLWNHNIFPEGTRILLFTAIVNGVIHQLTVAEIRTRTVVSAIFYGWDPCNILFQSSSCKIDQTIYYYTNFFTSLCCISLFFDRLLSSNLISYQYKFKDYVAIFLSCQTIVPIFILTWIYWDATYTGYVAMCNYPPSLTGLKFYCVNTFRLYGLGFFFILSVFIFYRQKMVEKKIIYNVYDTVSRYRSYENLLATKAVCIIIMSQISCLVITATGTEQIRKRAPPTVMEPLTGFMTGVTYSNFFLPLIIWYQTNQISERRRRAIGLLTSQVSDTKTHIESLKFSWEMEQSQDYRRRGVI